MDEMTSGEISRALDRIEKGFADHRREVAEHLGQMVSEQVYDLEVGALRNEVVALKGELAQALQDAKDSDHQRVVDRRWWIAAIAVPILLFLLNTALPILTGEGPP
ncbi:hypothetical protein ACFO4E_26990 [Nocardiopsis mangrovi]|uniref:DUF3618 domain-containing protein n=1 Tax=Nocardiopsis mangrovi TaxID=1179818 RepID=A0ABV9E5S7_9ACTN